MNVIKIIIGIVFIILVILGIRIFLSNIGYQNGVTTFYYNFIEANETPEIYVNISGDEFYRFFNTPNISNESLLTSLKSFSGYVDRKCKEKYNVSEPKFEEPWYSCGEWLNKRVFIKYNNRYYNVMEGMP